MFKCPETLAGVTTNLLAKERLDHPLVGEMKPVLTRSLDKARAEIGPEDVRPVPLDQCNGIIKAYRGYREAMGIPGPGPEPFC